MTTTRCLVTCRHDDGYEPEPFATAWTDYTPQDAYDTRLCHVRASAGFLDADPKTLTIRTRGTRDGVGVTTTLQFVRGDDQDTLPEDVES